VQYSWIHVRVQVICSKFFFTIFLDRNHNPSLVLNLDHHHPNKYTCFVNSSMYSWSMTGCWSPPPPLDTVTYDLAQIWAVTQLKLNRCLRILHGEWILHREREFYILTIQWPMYMYGSLLYIIPCIMYMSSFEQHTCLLNNQLFWRFHCRIIEYSKKVENLQKFNIFLRII
jgi:hypothetical protein